MRVVPIVIGMRMIVTVVITRIRVWVMEITVPIIVFRAGFLQEVPVLLLVFKKLVRAMMPRVSVEPWTVPIKIRIGM